MLIQENVELASAKASAVGLLGGYVEGQSRGGADLNPAERLKGPVWPLLTL